MSDFNLISQTALLRLESCFEVHGAEIYVWETSDTPRFDCYGIRVDEDFWLVLTPDRKGKSGEFIKLIPAGDVGLCEH